jgi:transcriptional regulator with XRE-family HTH domain
MELKHFLRQKRDELSLTQRQAAEKLGVSVLTWTSWERGQSPSVAHLFNIADWAGITVDAMRPMLMTEKKGK